MEDAGEDASTKNLAMWQEEKIHASQTLTRGHKAEKKKGSYLSSCKINLTIFLFLLRFCKLSWQHQTNIEQGHRLFMP